MHRCSLSSDPSGEMHPVHRRGHSTMPPCSTVDVTPTRLSKAKVFLHVLKLFSVNLLRQTSSLLALQESRSRNSGHQTVEGFHISAPATQRGVGGCQICIKDQWHTSRGNVRILHTDLRILHTSSQRIVVQLRKDDLRLILVCGHAPAGQDSQLLDSRGLVASNFKCYPVFTTFLASYCDVGCKCTSRLY